jgi:hypothetical protein
VDRAGFRIERSSGTVLDPAGDEMSVAVPRRTIGMILDFVLVIEVAP